MIEDLDLSTAADRLAVPPGDAADVMSRGRARLQRRRRITAAGTAVAMVVSVVAAVRLSRPDDGTVSVSGGVIRGSAGITWERVDAESVLGFARGFTGTSPIYAISTGPGERMIDNREPSRVIWRSEDGIEWTAVSTLNDDLYLADLSSSTDGRIYAVGTGPPTAILPVRPGLSSLVVGWSDDGGKDWQQKKLPFEFEPEGLRGAGVVGTEIAAGPRGTLAVVVMSASLNVASLVPDPSQAANGWSTNDSGVELLGPPSEDPCPEGTRPEASGPPPGEPAGEVQPTWCTGDDKEHPVLIRPQDAREVVARYTWAELGVDGDLLRAARQEPVAFLAPPGSTDFQRVEVPGLANVGVFALEATDRGFDLVATANRDRGPGRIEVWHSDDGLTWTPSAAPATQGFVAAIGSLNGKTAYVTNGGHGTNLTVADGSGGWGTVALADLVDAGGAMAWAGSAAIGPLGVVVQVSIQEHSEGLPEPGLPDQRILVSRDGTTWEEFSVEELTGDKDFLVTSVTMSGDRIVLVGQRESKRTDEPPPPSAPIVLVGTAD